MQKILWKDCLSGNTERPYTDFLQCLVDADRLVAVRTQFRNQLHALVQQSMVFANVRMSLERLIATLDELVASLEQEIASTLQQNKAWEALAGYAATGNNLGTLTFAWILTTTVKFACIAMPEAAGNYASLVLPWCQSASSLRESPRVGHGGNADLRRALYMASLSAVQDNPVIKPYMAVWNRKSAQGGAVCAAAHKLLRITSAVTIKDGDVDPS